MNILSSFLLPIVPIVVFGVSKTRVVTYSSTEFDVFSELVTGSGSSSTPTAKSSLFNAPLRDAHDSTNIVGLLTVRQSNMLRLGYNVQDFIDTFHFNDKNTGGSSLTIMSSFSSKNTGIRINEIIFSLLSLYALIDLNKII